MEKFGLSTSVEAVLESPQAWDATLADPQAHQSLLSWLLGLEPSPLHHARLA
jgi:hypothetical protein